MVWIFPKKVQSVLAAHWSSNAGRGKIHAKIDYWKHLPWICASSIKHRLNGINFCAPNCLCTAITFYVCKAACALPGHYSSNIFQHDVRLSWKVCLEHTLKFQGHICQTGMIRCCCRGQQTCPHPQGRLNKHQLNQVFAEGCHSFHVPGYDPSRGYHWSWHVCLNYHKEVVRSLLIFHSNRLNKVWIDWPWNHPTKHMASCVCWLWDMLAAIQTA